MGSLLVTTSVENLQNGINSVIRTFGNVAGIYVSLNKTHSAAIKSLDKSGIKTEKLFFIDCVSSAEERNEDTINIKPSELDKLYYAISIFIKEIKGEKYLLIDSLATLLLYNNEKKVAQFVKTLTDFSSQKNVEVIALSQRTSGEDLLNKIYNFFDKVDKKT